MEGNMGKIIYPESENLVPIWVDQITDLDTRFMIKIMSSVNQLHQCLCFH